MLKVEKSSQTTFFWCISSSSPSRTEVKQIKQSQIITVFEEDIVKQKEGLEKGKSKKSPKN